MPTISQWFLKLPEILEEFRRLDVPVIDRAVTEKVFGVSRRRAIQLMHQFGGYQVGKTFVVDREKLIALLETRQASTAFKHEQQRKTRLIEELERLRRLAPARRVRIAISSNVRHGVINGLPGGIHLEPGELRIEFFGAEDLLRNLFELSQAIVNDYARFEKLAEGTPLSPPGRGGVQG